MFFLRKKLYISREVNSYEARNSAKLHNVGRQFGGAKKHTSRQFNYKKNYSDRRKKYSNRGKNYNMQV